MLTLELRWPRMDLQRVSHPLAALLAGTPVGSQGGAPPEAAVHRCRFAVLLLFTYTL